MSCSLFFLFTLLPLVIGEISWPYESFQTGHWQPPHLNLTKSGEAGSEYIFIGVRKYIEAGTAPTIFDKNGVMVWQGPHGENLDFKMQKLFDQDVITYWDGQPGAMVLGYGTTHILDDTYNEIYSVTLYDNFQTADGKQFGSYIDGHEHYITPHNTMLVSALNFTQTDTSNLDRGKPAMWVIDSLFYEIDIETNNILFKWNAMEHIPISKSMIQIKGGKTPSEAWDAYHINSVTTTKHGYLVNFRHLHSGFYINKNGSIRWEISGSNDGSGDFMSENVKFAWQHDVRVHNETDESLVLSLMNNDAMENRDEGPSTGQVIYVDLVNKKAWMTCELKDPADRVVSATQGSFQFLPYQGAEHMLVGYGSMPKFKEFDRSGNVVLRGQFGSNPYEANAYRIFKFPWKATPHWDPILVVNHTTEYIVNLYMSWNGATEYDNWAIFSVPSETSNLLEGKRLLVHERAGFETHLPLETLEADFIIAAARDGEKIKGKSATIKLVS
ncbi:hypothetical protein N7462_006147 [Penicillium macrosclerotiorum]|uniref:uncharacterized protein n=1 Tax=Penicillium macrosclerotiorum TaxID=303699 RepID=UPI002546C2C2|nr:uncharacterized protein N7462_006147 [Penicillium macrosclerotiorum]KAJ5682982.1 hypothetical protein N7462_006147 [Penicillium macrosclerotiorum]